MVFMRTLTAAIFTLTLALTAPMLGFQPDPLYIHLGAERLRIDDARFFEQSKYGTTIPKLSFSITNLTSYPWVRITMNFNVAYRCGGEAHTWSRRVVMSLGWSADEAFITEYSESVPHLFSKVDGCVSDSITASLVSAEDANGIYFDGATGKRTDLREQRRQAEEAAKAERDRIEVEAREIAQRANAEREAQEARNRDELAKKAARLKRESDAISARFQKELDAKQKQAEEKRRKLTAICQAIRQRIANKSLATLTVAEADARDACRAAGLW